MSSGSARVNTALPRTGDRFAQFLLDDDRGCSGWARSIWCSSGGARQAGLASSIGASGKAAASLRQLAARVVEMFIACQWSVRFVASPCTTGTSYAMVLLGGEWVGSTKAGDWMPVPPAQSKAGTHALAWHAPLPPGGTSLMHRPRSREWHPARIPGQRHLRTVGIALVGIGLAGG